MSGSETVLLFVLIALGAAAYFLPFAIALFRRHRYKAVIFALNLIGGWSGVGWIAALIWAVWPSGSTVSDVVTHDPTGLSSRNVGTAGAEIANEFERVRSRRTPGPERPRSTIVFEVRLRDGVRRFTAESLPCVLGSGPDADIRIRHASVAETHAMARGVDGGIELVAMSPDAPLQADGAMVRRARIAFGGRFRLGDVPMTVRASGAAQDADGAG